MPGIKFMPRGDPKIRSMWSKFSEFPKMRILIIFKIPKNVKNDPLGDVVKRGRFSQFCQITMRYWF